VSLPELAECFWERNYVEQFLRENFASFIDPQHWRLSEKNVEHVDVDLLRFRPPEFEIMFTALTKNMETFHFYEALLLREMSAEGEEIRCEFTLKGQKLFLVNGFSSKEFVKGILERWCRRERQDFVDFVGTFYGIAGKAKVEINSLEPFFPPKEEPTANYIYRCRGSVHVKTLGKRFDVIIKKYVPREPPNRGNREYGIMRILPTWMVPRVHGGVVNHAYSIGGEAQVLVLFSDFVEGKNVGEIMWKLMLEIDKRVGEDYKAQLGGLHAICKEVIDKVIFPLHMTFRDLWYPFSYVISTPARTKERYFSEVSKSLNALTQAGLLLEEEATKLRSLFTQAWEEVLEGMRVAETHHDMMWAQIVRSPDGKLVVLDLDEHLPGHAAKDLADLCAASRFLTENLPCENRELMRKIANQINQTLLLQYHKNLQRTGAEWGRGIERALKVYLTLRHLHDAAYHLPIWKEAPDPAVKKRHEKYVNFSMDLLRESMGDLERTVTG
jgi:hypothetical protein